MIYFRGCVVRDKLQNISDATVTLLKKADVDYTLLEDERCCGSFLKRTGFMDDAHEVMERTLKQLEDTGDQKILVSCAGCYNTLKNDYKELFGVELDVVHSSEFFNQLRKDRRLKLSKGSRRVTYHDPCHLGRQSGVYSDPRELIESSCELVEMEKNMDHSRCCGAGAGVKSAFPETAREIASLRIQDAENTEAELLVTSCSFCILNLEDALNSKDRKCISGVVDVLELILMEIEHEEI